MSDQMAEAVQRQLAHAHRAAFVNRRGWTDDQWIADARSLMNDLDGAITSLVNGHVMAMLRRLDESSLTDTEVIEIEMASRTLAEVLADHPDRLVRVSWRTMNLLAAKAIANA